MPSLSGPPDLPRAASPAAEEPSRRRRDIRLLSWSYDLNLHARGLQLDANAASMLVHRALYAAFKAPLDARTDEQQRTALHARIDRDFAASRIKASTAETGRGGQS
jgi:hypothetical protein